MQDEQFIRLSEEPEDAYETIFALAREYSIEVLRELHEHGWSTATEIAKSLGIHVATAMRKLAELESLGILEKRERAGNNTTEYSPAAKKLQIVFDFEAEAKKASEGVWSKARKVHVKEKSNRHIVVEADEQQKLVKRLVFVKSLRRRTAAKILEVSETEGRFLWNLPFASDEAMTVSHVCRKAGIKSPLQVARLLEFVKEMEKMGVIEVVR